MSADVVVANTEALAPAVDGGARPPAGKPPRDLTSGPVGRTLAIFALPTLGSQILQSLNGSVNSIWVGHILGEDALAATLNGNMVSFLLMAFIFGSGMSATILVGKAVGAGDVMEARRVMGTTVAAFALISGLTAILGYLAAPQILHVLGTPPGAADLALQYLRVVFLGLPAGLLITLLMMGLRGSGDSLSPLGFTFFAVVLDVILNPVLIMGLGPLPAMGIAGSAMATAIANVAALIAMVGWIYARDLPIRLRGRELGFLKPRLGLLGEIVGKGLPMGLQMIVMTVAAMSVLGLVNREGVLTTAAYSIAQQLWGYVQMPAMAVAAGVSAMTAQALGAGNTARARAIARTGVVGSLTSTALIIAAVLACDDLLISMFLGHGSAALVQTRHILTIATWGFLFMAVTSVLFGHARAYGVVVRPLLIVIVAMFPLRLGFAFGAYRWIGADALWLSVPVGMVSTCLMAIVLHRAMSSERNTIGALWAAFRTAILFRTRPG